MDTLTKVRKLQEAVHKLDYADAYVQQALGASDLCYALHNKINNLADELESVIAQLTAQIG